MKFQGGRGARTLGIGLVWVWLEGCRGCRVVDVSSRVVLERDRGKRGLMGESGVACDVCRFKQLVSSWDVECCKGLFVSRYASGHEV